MLYVLPVVAYLISGRVIGIIILLYWAMSTCEMITSLVMRLSWYLYEAVISFPYLGHLLSDFIGNYTQSIGKLGGDTSPRPFPSLFSFRLITTVFENFEYPWDAQASVLLVLCLLTMFQVLFRATKRLFKSTTQRSVPKLDMHGWHGMWKNVGRYLENFSPPVTWKFTPEQLQNPDEVIEFLKEKCCGYPRDTQLTTLCWALAGIYQTLLDIRQHPQGEKGEKIENTTTSTVATPTPMTSTVAAPTTTTGTVATPILVTDTAAKPENQPVPVSVAPVQKKKHTKKSVRLVRDESEPGSSREQEEEVEPEIITRSLSMSELCDMRKDFSRHPGEHIVTWLLRCWDSGASSVELEGKEAKQLGSLSREGGIDKAIGRKTQVLSLWRRLLLGVKERYPFRDEVTCHQGKWTSMERGIQYLRELAVLEVIYNDPENGQSPTDPDEVQCTQAMWRKFLRSAPPTYANSLAVMSWKEGYGQTVDELAVQLRQYEGSLSSSLRACVSAVEELSREFQQFKVDMSSSSPVQARIAVIGSKRSSAQERGERKYTRRANLWFYLRDYGEDMRKWDGKPTSVLDARVRELRDKATRKEDSSWKTAAPVSREQSPRRSRWADLISDPLEGTSDSRVQKRSAGHSLLSLGGASSTPGIDCPRGGNTAPLFAMD
ncbi:uncharacterized protein LOC142031085 [Buteo buteo]|uniref:uncharacterized protein LOC142031085 n=1 Tax=Buteo buteo TaxID=30397 RepID=UPI003EB7348D